MNFPDWTNWAVWGLVGAGIVSFVVPRVLTWIFGWSSRLIVRVTVSDMRATPSLYEEVKNVSKRDGPTDEEFKERWKVLDKLRSVLNAEGYVRMELKNNSRKKLTNLTISTVRRGWMQIGDGGDLVEVPPETLLKLGDLQPEGKLVIHLLTGIFLFDGSGKGFKEKISLLADEHARVSYQFPVPDHFARRRTHRIAMSLVIFGGILAIASILVPIITSVVQKLPMFK